MDILDLIFDNIYVVIVVLFAVFKILGSFSRNNKPTSMPTFGGEQNNKWDDEDEVVEEPSTYPPYSTENTHQTREKEAVQSSKASERVRQQPDPIAPSFEEMKREQLRRQQLAKQRVAAAQKLVTAPNKATQLGTKDLREAVIWSEILGQPRAKRPFRK